MVRMRWMNLLLLSWPLMAQSHALDLGLGTLGAPARGAFSRHTYRALRVEYMAVADTPAVLRGAFVVGGTFLSGEVSWSTVGPGMWDYRGERYQPSRSWHVGGRWVTSGRIQVAFGADARLLLFREEGQSGDIGNGLTDTRLTPWGVVQVRTLLASGVQAGLQVGRVLRLGSLVGGDSARPHPDQELLGTVGFRF